LSQLLREEVHLSRGDRTSSRYRAVPFEVPAGTGEIQVSYEYAGQGLPGSANQIDLGLSDQRGLRFPGLPGFRGWSGGARREIMVAADTATPGYLPGIVEPGTWHVLLGLYEVAEGGVDVQVRISLRDGRPAAAGAVAPVARSAPPPEPLIPGTPPKAAQSDRRWLRGELHSHTEHSDAPGSLTELIAAAEDAGLDFLAVTEHNTTSHLRELSDARTHLLLLPGLELTTYQGHLNVWGVSGPLDFRCHTASGLGAVARAALAAGCVISASHPFAPGMEWGFGFELPLHGLEVWHGPCLGLNRLSYDMWVDLLRQGRRLFGYGGADTHIGKPATLPPGTPVTWLLAEPSTAGILAALAGGRVCLAAAYNWLELSARRDGHTWCVGDESPAGDLTVSLHGQASEPGQLRLWNRSAILHQEPVVAGAFATELQLELAAGDLLRADLTRPALEAELRRFPLLALTNPIWTAAGQL